MTKENQNHTPGPWTVSRKQMGYSIDAQVAHGESFDAMTGQEIAPHTATARIASVLACGESAANARLIAAAPELLETAKMIRDTLAINQNNPLVSGLMKDGRFDLLVNAIRRAEGRS